MLSMSCVVPTAKVTVSWALAGPVASDRPEAERGGRDGGRQSGEPALP